MVDDLPSRRHKIRKASINWINELPNDILLQILSSLTMKEAGRTSVLSKRWRHVKSYLSTLNFDSCHIEPEIRMANKAFELKHNGLYKSAGKPTYVHWVDQVLSSHNSPTIDEFMVHYVVQEDSGHIIDNWVRFAMEKRVKRLNLDLPPIWRPLSAYNFPSSYCCDSLTSLELSGVHVTGQDLEAFLYNCHGLELLSVNGSDSLVDMKVVGPSLNLKYLMIYYCQKIELLEISAPNLVYFGYYGPQISVPFKSIPKLAEISIGGLYIWDFEDNFMEHFSYLSQLEAVTLNLSYSVEPVMEYVQFPEWTRLKMLDIIVNPYSYEDLLCVKSLLKACPLLHKLVLQLDDNTPKEDWKPLRERNVRRHHKLKVVEVVGFDGEAIDLEYEIYLLDIAVSLEKITLDPRKPQQKDSAFQIKRAKAKQLSAYLKSGTDLIVL